MGCLWRVARHKHPIYPPGTSFYACSLGWVLATIILMKTSISVPEALKPRFQEIVSITDAFCQEKLNPDYALLCRELAAAISRKRPSPLANGPAKSWACGIAYTIGSINYLFDKSQNPNMRADDLCAWFGYAPSTGGNRAKQIKDMLKIGPFDVRYMLPALVDENPMVWMVSINGFIIDARTLRREIQEEAFRKGLIPYVPGEKKPEV
jgi:hypothetical protein